MRVLVTPTCFGQSYQGSVQIHISGCAGASVSFTRSLRHAQLPPVVGHDSRPELVWPTAFPGTGLAFWGFSGFCIPPTATSGREHVAGASRLLPIPISYPTAESPGQGPPNGKAGFRIPLKESLTDPGRLGFWGLGLFPSYHDFGLQMHLSAEGRATSSAVVGEDPKSELGMVAI